MSRVGEVLEYAKRHERWLSWTKEAAQKVCRLSEHHNGRLGLNHEVSRSVWTMSEVATTCTRLSNAEEDLLTCLAEPAICIACPWIGSSK